MDFSNIRGILCDIGGVLYVGDTPVDGAVGALASLKRRYPLRLLTNTTQKTSTQVVHRLGGMGFAIDAGEVLTALDVTHRYLETRGSGAELLLTDDAEAFFDDLQSLPRRYVVVGDAQENFTYTRMNRAFRTLMAGGELLAAAKNRYFKDADGKLSMDAGGFVSALEYASGKEAKVIGKPSKDFYRLACDALGTLPEETLMIGDDIESDILGAQEAGLKAVLVRTGKYTPADLSGDIRPDAVVASVAKIPALLETVPGETDAR